MVQYEHGKNLEGKPIHISQVNKNGKIKYFCIFCDKELIPKTGNINEHHFAHKNKNIDCSKEKYFQLLGKMLFFEIYNECKNNNEPFSIILKDKCENNKLCKYNNYKTYNLLQYFESIEMGDIYDFKIYDLRIYNKKEENIYIVTYYFNIINKENDYGNNRVIEIKINCEDDLKPIKNKLLSEENQKIIFHNFKRSTVIPQNCRNCYQNSNDAIKLKNNYEEKIEQSNKYILLKFNGEIKIKIMEQIEFQKIKKLYRHYKIVNTNIDYNLQFKEFVNECKNNKWKIIEVNDFW